MRKRAGLIIFNSIKSEIVLIERIKNNEVYWVIPGGGVEQGEGFIEAAIREIAEELNITDIKKDEVINGIYEVIDETIHCYYVYLVRKKYELDIIGEESKRNRQENQYNLHWISTDEIACLNIKPDKIKFELIRLLNYFNKRKET